jgi:hypothetical protein
MRGIKMSIIVAMATILGGLTLTTSVLMGKPEYSKKEKKGCTFCHVKAGSKELNDIGVCYGKHKHSLEGCEAK